MGTRVLWRSRCDDDLDRSVYRGKLDVGSLHHRPIHYLAPDYVDHGVNNSADNHARTHHHCGHDHHEGGDAGNRNVGVRR